jgi:hypothetical protein
LLKDNGVYIFESPDFIEGNGWSPGSVKNVTEEDVADLPLRGVINEINPPLYGPLGS